MSEFTWNKGGNYGKPWAEHLITDASVSFLPSVTSVSSLKVKMENVWAVKASR